jgi:hypothetical protein
MLFGHKFLGCLIGHCQSCLLQITVARGSADHDFKIAGFNDVMHADGEGCKRFLFDVKRNCESQPNSIHLAVAVFAMTSLNIQSFFFQFALPLSVTFRRKMRAQKLLDGNGQSI